jgi:hypothetical protein
MNYLKRQLLSGWHLARWIRLALGIILLVQAIDTREYFFGAIGLLLLYQALTNTGCCATGAWTVPPAKSNPPESHDTIESK